MLARLDRRLCGARRADPSAQPALDRRDARHELRLAGAGDPACCRSPAARRRTGCSALMALQAALRAVPDHRGARSSRLVVHFGLMRTSYGAILRGAGGNPAALERAGWSLLQDQDRAVRAGRPLRRAVRHGADRHHHLGRRQYRQRLHAAVDRRRDPRRRRVRRRPGLADRRGDRRADPGARRLAAPHLHAHPARLAGRRQWRDPDHRAGGAGADQPQGEAERWRCVQIAARQALDLVLRRRRCWSGSPPSPSPAATAPAA